MQEIIIKNENDLENIEGNFEKFKK